MKQCLKSFLLTLLLTSSVLVNAQISEGGVPPSFQSTNMLRSSVSVPVQKLDVKLDVKRLIWEDSIAEKNHAAVRVAETFPVNVNIDSTGNWTTLADGQRIWQETVSAIDAEGLIISYKDFYIPEGGKLFIYNNDKTQILGAYTNSTNKNGGSFVTEIVHGDSFTLEYVASSISKEKPRIVLLDVGYIYDKGALLRAAVDNNLNYNVPNNSCISNINCYPENNKWKNQKRGVVLFLVKKDTDVDYPPSWLGCTGSLINNTQNSGVPYLLTAAHCLIANNYLAKEGSFIASIFYFNYEDPTCITGVLQPSFSQTIVGSDIKAFIPLNGGRDAALLQLSSDIPKDYNVYFNGWDRRSRVPANGAIIHHPNRDVKKITKFEPLGANPAANIGTLEVLIPNTYTTVFGASSAHIKVQYSDGVTQYGSSGAPMFNEDGLIVGTLSAGATSCSSPNSLDYYGRLFYHWDRYQSDETNPKQARALKEFLDPDGKNPETLAGFDPNGTSGNNDGIVEDVVDFVIFPNPADNDININAKSLMRSVQIYDVAGRLLYSKKDYNASTLSVNVSGWSSGVYSVVVQTTEGKISDKFIKK